MRNVAGMVPTLTTPTLTRRAMPPPGMPTTVRRRPAQGVAPPDLDAPCGACVAIVIFNIAGYGLRADVVVDAVEDVVALRRAADHHRRFGALERKNRLLLERARREDRHLIEARG